MKYYDKPEAWKREMEEAMRQCTGKTRKSLIDVGFTSPQADELEPIINAWTVTYTQLYAFADLRALVRDEDDAEDADRMLDKILKDSREKGADLRDSFKVWKKYQALRHQDIETAFDRLKAVLYEAAASV